MAEKGILIGSVPLTAIPSFRNKKKLNNAVKRVWLYGNKNDLNSEMFMQI